MKISKDVKLRLFQKCTRSTKIKLTDLTTCILLKLADWQVQYTLAVISKPEYGQYLLKLQDMHNWITKGEKRWQHFTN